MTITEKAKAELQKLFHENPGKQLRIGVEGFG